MTSADPVSVVIPCYQAAQFIAGALNSVFSQLFTDFEVIVVNDGSPDSTAFERALAPYRSRLIYLKQENTGPSGARNLGINAARGTYVALLDSDDLWAPEYLAVQMSRLKGDPTVDLLYANGVIEGGPLDGRLLMDVAPSHPNVTVERLIAEECTVLTSCTVVRRQAVIDAGWFDARFRRSEDVHLWLRIAARGGRIAWHPAPLVTHRRRPGSLADDTAAMVRAYIDVLEDLAARRLFTDAQHRLARRQIAKRQSRIALDDARRLFVGGRYPDAAEALERAGAFAPQTSEQLRLALFRMGIRAAPRLLHRAYELLRGPGAAIMR